MAALASQLDNQAFLSYQCEVALVPIFCFGNGAIGAYYKSNWRKVFVFSLMMAACAMLALSAHQEANLRLASIGVRLLLTAFLGYAAAFKPRKSRAERAFVWIILDPLGWLVEVAIFLQLNDPIFEMVWLVRRATITACFLACLSDPDPRIYTGMKAWTFVMAAVMGLQIVMNLYWVDQLIHQYR